MTRTKQNGFTIVELLIVIVVIGILAAITIVAFNGVQARARDSERVSEIKSIHKKLEIYHAEKGYYPTSTQMMNATFRQDMGLSVGTLTPPGSGSSLGYCWSNAPDRYCYVSRRAVPVAGNYDCTGSVDPNETCISYALSYRLESNPTVEVRQNSLNNSKYCYLA